jgi:hypothetical protein
VNTKSHRGRLSGQGTSGRDRCRPRRGWALVGLLVCGLAAPPAPGQTRGQTLGRPAEQTTASGYRSQHALIIGVDAYRDPFYGELAAAVADAQGLARVLVDEFGFPPRQVRLLTNEEADKAAIEQAFQGWLWDAERIQPDDLVVVFFAGHGVTKISARGRSGFLVPSDGRSESGAPQWSSLIPMWTLEKISEEIPSEHVVFILDCCFGGLATLRSAPSAPGLANRSRQVLCAGNDEQPVLDDAGSGHSVFTRALLGGLVGEADGDEDGVISFGELFVHVSREVHSLTGGRQTPIHSVFPDHEGGSVAFLRPGAALAEPDGASLPAWVVSGTDPRFPGELFVTGVGHASATGSNSGSARHMARMQAKARAMNDIMASMAVIEVTQARGGETGGQRSSTTIIQSSSTTTLGGLGSLLTEEAFDAAQGTQHALVVLNRLQHGKAFLAKAQQTLERDRSRWEALAESPIGLAATVRHAVDSVTSIASLRSEASFFLNACADMPSLLLQWDECNASLEELADRQLVALEVLAGQMHIEFAPAVEAPRVLIPSPGKPSAEGTAGRPLVLAAGERLGRPSTAVRVLAFSDDGSGTRQPLVQMPVVLRSEGPRQPGGGGGPGRVLLTEGRTDATGACALWPDVVVSGPARLVIPCQASLFQVDGDDPMARRLRDALPGPVDGVLEFDASALPSGPP